MAKLERKKVLGKGTGGPPAGFADVFYIEELRLQCEFGVRAFGEIQQRVVNMPKDLGVFAFIQMMLGFAGNASKLLGPPKQSGAVGKARAARLRKKLALMTLPMLEDRTARNFVEHFDERLDAALGKLNGIILHRLVGDSPAAKVDLDGKEVDAHYLLHFNPATFELSFLGDTIALAALAKELDQVAQTAASYLKSRPGHLPNVAPRT